MPLRQAGQSAAADKQQLISLMSEEGEELRARTDKLEEDKRNLHYELAAAQARLQAGGGGADNSPRAAAAVSCTEHGQDPQVIAELKVLFRTLTDEWATALGPLFRFG